MTDVRTLSATKILSITEPEKLFTLAAFNTEFMRLRKKWHPDYNSDPLAEEVFARIYELQAVGQARIDNDTWSGASILNFTTSDNKEYQFKYLQYSPFELGKMYIGRTTVVYVIDEANKDLFDDGTKAIAGIKYPQPKMKEEFSKLMPNITLKAKTNIGYVVVMKKTKDAVLLRDLIDHMPDKKLDPKHVAWIVGSLYNLTTFLDFIGISHNSILPSTLFVSPKYHSVMIYGGWWYSTKIGNKLKAIPSELTKVLPNEVFVEKIAKSSYDRLAVKGVAVGCLGDPTLVGSKLLADKEIPKPMLNWLRKPSGGSALEEYQGWDETLIKSFGKREFIEFDFDTNNMYE